MKYKYMKQTAVIFQDEKNFCVVDPPSCTTEGVCSEEAEGFSCLCNDGFGGETCGIVQNFPLPLLDPKFCEKKTFLLQNFLNLTDYTSLTDSLQLLCLALNRLNNLRT